MKPIFDAVAKDYADDIKFVKVNVDQESDLASRYGIQGIPVVGNDGTACQSCSSGTSPTMAFVG